MKIKSGLNPRRKAGRRREGVALIIVLAFVVILTGVVVAYFSRALANRQISNSSASQTKVALFAQGAADSIIADLQAEIQLCSTGASVTTGTITNTFYVPTSQTTMVPQMSGTKGLTSWAPNFLIRSASNQNFYTGTPYNILSNAVGVSSTVPSLNGRSVSLARWNEHYLLPLATGSDSTPVSPSTDGSNSNAFLPPDWVLVARDGSNPVPTNPSTSGATWSGTNSSTVIGRYAYAIYREGGLLDANVAGYPVLPTVTNSNSQTSYKPALAYADLTVLPGLAGSTDAPAVVDQLVAWRNASSAQAPNPYQQAVGGSVYDPFRNGGTTSSGSNYYNFVTSNPTGFLQISSTSLSESGTGSTDRMFSSRQELISFVKNALGLSGTALNVLNYLATFTRGLDQPSYTPDPTRPLINSLNANGGNNVDTLLYGNLELKDSSGQPDPINPSFLTLRISGTFVRNDGTPANVGDPLVKTRFPLSRLAWITYQGPSSVRAGHSDVTSATPPSPSSADYDLWKLVHVYGVPQSYLVQGTPQNIYNNFGLIWAEDKEPTATRGSTAITAGFHDNEYKWFYVGHVAPTNSSAGTATYTAAQALTSNTTGSISRLQALANLKSQGREPDFFELLKAAVADGSLAKGAFNTDNVSKILGTTHPYYYQNKIDTDLDYAVLQLGANIIDQAKVDGFSTRIVFYDATDTFGHEVRGAENLPYLYRTNAGTLDIRQEEPQFTGTTHFETATLQDPGVAVITLVPTIWNPYDANAPMGTPGPAGPGAINSPVTSGSFRVIVDSVSPDQLLLPTSGTAAAISDGYETFGAYGENTNQSYISPSSSAISGSLWTTGTDGSGAPLVPSLLGASAAGSPFVPNNSQMLFSATNPLLFREPTILAMTGFPKSSQLHLNANGPPLQIPQYNQIRNSKGTLAWSSSNGGGFLCDARNPNPLDLPTAPSPSQAYIGFFAGIYPIQFETKNVIYHSDFGDLVTLNGPGWYITYRLQYQDPNATTQDGSGTGWVTYDEKFTQFNSTFLGTAFAGAVGNLTNYADFEFGAPGNCWQSYVDPRTSRFAGINGADLEQPVTTPGGSNESGEWADADPGFGTQDQVGPESVTDRPDANAGYPISINRTKQVDTEFLAVVANGWTISQLGNGHYRTGMLSQNSNAAGIADNGIRFNGDGYSTAGDGPQPTYFADPDQVVRGAMGYYQKPQGLVPASSTVGLPLATAYPGGVTQTSGTYQAESRPYFLHRPFRSVAELGYVFSGTPWKNIDFFTPQSGDVALLDVFSAFEPPAPTANPNPLVAGVVDLNTQQAPVLAAILSGAYTDEVASSSTSSNLTSPFAPFTAQEANALFTTTSGTSPSLTARTASTSTGQGPLENVGDLVGRWNKALGTLANGFSGPSADLTNIYSQALNSGGLTPTEIQTIQYVDRFHEAFLRPLAAVGNTRVWNLMIDVIAQTGRYPTGTSNPASFVVDGEQRYWVHVAIDRFTGQVLDKQVELVKE